MSASKTISTNTDIQRLLDLLPAELIDFIEQKPVENLIEIVLDLGRNPEFRFKAVTAYHLGMVVDRELLDSIVDSVELTGFGNDNRAGVQDTLHRVSCIRARNGDVVGLTMRVGKEIAFSRDAFKHLHINNRSVLLIGQPGKGKTTLLRKLAKHLANHESKRVMIIDKSDEIAGDSIVPHDAVGNSRRMSVPDGKAQFETMIEAVENHMPEVIIVDEVSTTAEARAVVSVAERGVHVIATAHGENLDSILRNTAINIMLGQVKSVTLTDTNAGENGGNKIRLEREFFPAFDTVIELKSFDSFAVYDDIVKCIDARLRGGEVKPDIYKLSEDVYVRVHTGQVIESRFAELEKYVTPEAVENFEKPRRRVKVRD